MKLIVKKGRTSLLVRVFIQDSSSTTGAGLTGLTSGSAGLVCYRARDDDGNAAATQVTLSGGTRGTWSSGGFVEKDATNMPGVYELGLPDAGQATGSESVTYMLKGATNMAPLPLEIQLVAYDPQDTVRLGLTSIPNVASGSAGALLVDGTGTAAISNSAGKVLLQATQTGVTIPTVTTVTNQLTAAAIATGVWQDSTAGDFTTASSIGKSLYTTGNAPGAASGLALVGSNMGTVSSVTGSVGSVTGAVGSVTGNVGGSVASVVAAVTIDGTSALAESYRANGAAPTVAQALCEILAHLGESAISGTTKTIKKLDHATTAETFTLDSATTPASITRAT